MTFEHHPFGGSRIGLRARCPASYRVSQGIAPREADQAAELGTLMHEILAGAKHDTSGWKSWDREVLARCERYRDDLLAAGDQATATYEERLGPVPLEGIPEALWPYATADLVLRSHTRLAAAILDYKTGPLDLDEGLCGPQMFLQAWLLMEQEESIEHVRVLIFHAQSDLELVEVLTRSQLPALRAKIRDIIIRAMEPEAPYLASATGCARCEGSHHCPAALSIMRRFSADDIKRLDTLSAGELAALYDRADLVEKVAETVKAAVKELAVKGTELPGFKLGSHQTRSIENLFAAYHRGVSLGVSLQEFLDCCRLSITEYEKRWVDAYAHVKGWTKERAKVAFGSEMRDLIKLSDLIHTLRRTYKRREIGE